MRRGVQRSKTRLMLAFSLLASLPRRGSLVASALRLRFAFLLSAFRYRGCGKRSVSLGGCTAFSSMGSLGWRASRALWIKCCRVALSSVRGDGMFGMVVQSSFRICRHLGATVRSQCGVFLMLRLILPSELGLRRPRALASMRGPRLVFAEMMFAWWGWPIAIICHRGSRGGRPGRVL